ncbi:MAG: stage II sporulation protein P [Oscillibacter sp.]|nr:stage II sporulation protein P [Oscillibacter sp.]
MNLPFPAGLTRRVFSALLGLAALCAAGAAAGRESAASAAQALREAASLAAERLELGAYDETAGLSTAALLALRQTPLLYSARDNPLLSPEAEPGDAAPIEETPSDSAATDGVREIAPATDGASAESESETPQSPIPLQEAAQEPIPQVDNGVRARTLVPKSADGYAVCGRVYISSSRKKPLNTEALRDTFDAELSGDGPQILILHSHGSEAYTPAPGTELVWWGDARTTDFRYSVVRVGDEMASVFENAGISVIHDRTLYDYPDYSGSYDRSLSAIESYLAQYPSIRFVLDVHRDYIADSGGNQYKVISEIEGRGTAAQMTLVMGSDGSGLSHPRWMENLKLAVAIQERILSDYPTLMRPMLLRKSRYNQHATTGSLLVEVGAAGNSPEEALLSARLFAEEMTEVLQARSK